MIIQILIWLIIIFAPFVIDQLVYKHKAEIGIPISTTLFFMSLLLFPLTNLALAGDLKRENVITGYNDLVALKNQNSIEGKASMLFFIGSAYIKETPYYIYYRKNKNGEIYQDKVKAQFTPIIETNEKSPRIEYVQKQFVGAENISWAWNPKAPMYFFGEEFEYKRLIVPPGTVDRGFSLKL